MKTGLKNLSSTGNPPILLMPLYLWTFVSIGRPQDIFPFLLKLHPGKLCAGLTILTYCTCIKKVNKNILRTIEVKLFIALCLLMAISGPFGVYPGLSFHFLTGDFYKTIIYFLILIKVLTTIKDVERLAWTIIISAVVMAIAAVLTGQAGSARVSIGTMYDPNDFAMMFVISLPFVLFFFSRSKGLKKLIFGCCNILILLAIILTKSRSGFLGLVMVIVAFLFSESYKNQTFRKIALLILLCLLFSGFASTFYWNRIQTIWKGDDQGSGREILWKRGLKLMFQKPLLGSGVSCYMSAYGGALVEGEFEPIGNEYDRKWKVAHNSFLTIGVELGLIGLIIYLILIYCAIKNFTETKRLAKINGLRDIYEYADMFRISLIGFLVCAFFLSQAYSINLFLILAVSNILKRILDANYNPEIASQ